MLIFVLISLTCVSAADDNQTSDIVEINEIDEEIISEDANDVGTFKELATEINGATSGSKIELTKNYTYNPTTDSSYKTNGVKFSTNNLEIDGKGHTISGAGQAQRLFYYNGYSLTIKNTTFTKSTSWGLYIYNNGLTLINCTFIDNTGEAITTIGNSGNNKIINCTFIHNKGSNIAGTFENCKFINNTGTSGGAIHTSVVYPSTLINCTFENNTARSGGAVYFNFAPTLINCKFINNRATEFTSTYKGGGAIFKSDHMYGTVSIINSTFIDNTDPNGIALYAAEAWEIINSTFQNSAVHINSSMTYSKTTYVEIENSKFIDCNLINSNGNLTLSKNTFENGYIKNDGTILTQTYFIVPDYNQNLETHSSY